MRNITKIIEDTKERVEGNLMCDIAATNWTYKNNIVKIRNLQYLCKNKKKIMEIGVNGCHSLIIMLLENSTADYLLFDLGMHTYTSKTVQYTISAFPQASIKIVYGNSVETITKYIDENPNEIGTYDLIHLDGGHTEDIYSFDYANSKKLIKSDGIVVFDDYNYGAIHRFINEKVRSNEIVEVDDPNVKKTPLHFVYKCR